MTRHEHLFIDDRFMYTVEKSHKIKFLGKLSEKPPLISKKNADLKRVRVCVAYHNISGAISMQDLKLGATP